MLEEELEKCVGFLIDGQECYKINSYYFKKKFAERKVDLEKMDLIYVPKSRVSEIVLSSFDENGRFKWNIEKIKKYAV